MTWERALEADARRAAKNAILITAALRQSFDAERAFLGYQNTTPNLELNLTQQRRNARAWAIMNIRPNMEPLREVLYRVWAEGFVLGNAAAWEELENAYRAQKANTQGLVDWSKWKPGDGVSALILKPPKAFQKLIEQAGFTLKGFSDTTLTDIGNAIGEAITLGLDARKASKLISKHVASPARALSIAITEQNRAISAATINRYQLAGLQEMEWLVFDPCKICAENANKKVKINTPFPSGALQPPAHPNCRCALAPVITGFDDPSNTGGSITTPTITPTETLQPSTDYRGYHTAPTRADDVGGPATDIETGLMPDFYTRPSIYRTGMDVEDKESISVLMSIRNKPEAIVTIYRAVPHGITNINRGDWVTLSRSYAETHLSGNVQGGGHIITMRVPAKDLWFDGNSINEFGYDPVSTTQKFSKTATVTPKFSIQDDED